MSSSKKDDYSLSSMDAFSKVDNLVSKPVLGSDGAASWQSFRKDHHQHHHQPKRASVAPKAPLKKADKLGTGFTSWEEERKHEDQVRHKEGHVATGSGYTTFKKKNNAEEAAERKRIKMIESRKRPDNKSYHIPADTFQGWKFDYIFTTRSEYGTGYFWDGMDSIKKLRGEALPESKTESSSAQDDSENAAADAATNDSTIDKPKKKKRKKNAGPVIVHDPNNPMEQVAAVIQKRNQRLFGATADATLPEGWEIAKDPFSGNVYYFKRSTGERSWENPSTSTPQAESTNDSNEDKPETDASTPPLPSGWQAVADSSTGKTYYYHTDGRTQWDRPT